MSSIYSGASTVQEPPVPIYVGLDLSLTSTGVAIIHGDRATTHRVTSNGRKGATSLETADRITDIIQRIRELVPPSEHTRIAIEAPSYGSTGSAAHVIAGLWWSVRAAFRDDDVVLVPPATVKKYATGRGNAGKDEVLASVVRRYPHVPVSGNDEADALVLAAIRARIEGHPVEDQLPAANTATLATAVSR